MKNKVLKARVEYQNGFKSLNNKYRLDKIGNWVKSLSNVFIVIGGQNHSIYHTFIQLKALKIYKVFHNLTEKF